MSAWLTFWVILGMLVYLVGTTLLDLYRDFRRRLQGLEAQRNACLGVDHYVVDEPYGTYAEPTADECDAVEDLLAELGFKGEVESP